MKKKIFEFLRLFLFISSWIFIVCSNSSSIFSCIRVTNLSAKRFQVSLNINWIHCIIPEFFCIYINLRMIFGTVNSHLLMNKTANTWTILTLSEKRGGFPKCSIQFNRAPNNTTKSASFNAVDLAAAMQYSESSL